jgi:transposase
MKAYSSDLRQRVLEDCDGGMETRQVAVKYRVSESWIRRLKQRRRETGETTPRSSRNRRSAKWLVYGERIKELIRQKPDATLRELSAELNHALSGQTLSRALRALGLVLKKSPACRRAGSAGRGQAATLVEAVSMRPGRTARRVPR